MKYCLVRISWPHGSVIHSIFCPVTKEGIDLDPVLKWVEDNGFGAWGVRITAEADGIKLDEILAEEFNSEWR